MLYWTGRSRTLSKSLVAHWIDLLHGVQAELKPSRRALETMPSPNEMAPLEALVQLGRGFGSVRTSFLHAALKQLVETESQGQMSDEQRGLRDAIERQLSRRRSWKGQSTEPS